MIPAGELYEQLNTKIPESLRCDWDNDGMMCCPDPAREVKKILLALDVTDATVEFAVAGGYDLILTHHPLIFSPIRAMNPANPTARRVIRLISAGISVFSFHTRLDAVEGGVNDVLAARIGLTDTHPFGLPGEEIGLIGKIAPTSFADFAAFVKKQLNAPVLEVVSTDKTVRKVALVGGAGKDYLPAAIAAGADVYLTGEMCHHADLDAADAGIGLILAGHYYTELPVLDRLRSLAAKCDQNLEFGYFDHNPVGFL